MNNEDMNGDGVVKRIYKRNQCLDGLGRVWEFNTTVQRWVLTGRTKLQFEEQRPPRPGMQIGELSVRKLLDI